MKTHKRSRALSFLIVGIIAITAILTCPPPRSVVQLRKGRPQIVADHQEPDFSELMPVRGNLMFCAPSLRIL